MLTSAPSLFVDLKKEGWITPTAILVSVGFLPLPIRFGILSLATFSTHSKTTSWTVSGNRSGMTVREDKEIFLVNERASTEGHCAFLHGNRDSRRRIARSMVFQRAAIQLDTALQSSTLSQYQSSI